MNPFALFKTLDNIDLKELREQLRLLNDWVINLLELTQKDMHNSRDKIKELEEQRNILKSKLADKCWEKCHLAAQNGQQEC
jgi:hypothetical protein